MSQEYTIYYGMTAIRLCEVLGVPVNTMMHVDELCIRLEIAVREDRMTRDEMFRLADWLAWWKQQLLAGNFPDKEECLGIYETISTLCYQKLQ